jgi:hypothetical protein
MSRFAVAIILPVLIASCRPASAVGPVLLPQELRDAGWVQLFDGRTLAGWQPTGEASWEVVDGTIRTAGEKPGFLMTTAEFADFELHVEFRVPAATNSGVFFRSALQPTDPTRDCYELNIAPAGNPFPTGSLVARKQAALAAEDSPLPDQWHTFDVTADGGKITVLLDGHLILAYDDPSPVRRGHVGLQSNLGEVAFRNIRVRKLPR